MANDLIYIAIIEDNAAIRQGWEMVLNNAENMRVIGSFTNCEQAFASSAIAEADIVLMDIGLPGMSGIEERALSEEKYPQQIIVMCTVHEDNEKIFDALCAGAVGYLLKKAPPDKLVDALREAYQGGSP